MRGLENQSHSGGHSLSSTVIFLLTLLTFECFLTSGLVSSFTSVFSAFLTSTGFSEALEEDLTIYFLAELLEIFLSAGFTSAFLTTGASATTLAWASFFSTGLTSAFFSTGAGALTAEVFSFAALGATTGVMSFSTI